MDVAASPQVVFARQLPQPQETVAHVTPWPLRVNWYGGGRRHGGVVNGRGHWYRSGCGLAEVRWVYVEDREGTHRPEYFFSTDPQMSVRQIVESYTLRWSIEVTFEAIRAHLGFNTTRHRSPRACNNSLPKAAKSSSIGKPRQLNHLQLAKVESTPRSSTCW